MLIEGSDHTLELACSLRDTWGLLLDQDRAGLLGVSPMVLLVPVLASPLLTDNFLAVHDDRTFIKRIDSLVPSGADLVDNPALWCLGRLN